MEPKVTSNPPIRLEQEETSAIFAPPDNYRQYKARNILPELLATIEAFENLDTPRQEILLMALENCSSHAYFVRHIETGDVRVHAARCRQRWCPICAQILANWRTMALIDWIQDIDRPKFITLTLKHSPAPLQQQIDRLYDCFRNLRKQKFFKQSIRGGVWFFQVKQSASDRLWHPHLHIVADANFIPKERLSRAWLFQTGSSKIVDIHLIHTPAQTAKYVARYSARPANLAELTLGRRIELIESMAGRRLCGTWGTARAIKLNPPHLEDKEKWHSVGSWLMVINCLSTSEIARSIFRAWRTSTPIPEDCTLSPVEEQLSFPEYATDIEAYSGFTPDPRSPPQQQSTFRDLLGPYELPPSAQFSAYSAG